MTRPIGFFPAPDESGSPAEIIDGIEDKNEQQRLRHRLEMLGQREPHQWNMDWCKRYDKIWQMRTEHYRAIIVVEPERLVVIDAFKKQSGKTAKVDKKRRELRLKAYLDYLNTRKKVADEQRKLGHTRRSNR